MRTVQGAVSRDLVAADRYATMLTHHAGRHGADVWLTYGRCLKGMVLIKRDEFDVDVPMLSTAVAELRAARGSTRRSHNRTRPRSAGFDAAHAACCGAGQSRKEKA